jgi:hypothetical protein
MRFEPMVMARDLATSVELLSAAIEAIPADRLDNQTPNGCSALSRHHWRPCARRFTEGPAIGRLERSIADAVLARSAAAAAGSRMD